MKRTTAVILLATVLNISVLAAPARTQNFGRFTGDLHFKWLIDGRKMELLTEFGYIDSAGRAWDVPRGAITDGASIPRVFWSFAAPFEGTYRDAAVVHDYYCEVKTRPWRETHLIFYTAMRARGVDKIMAKTLYGAVYFFGPRWGIGTASRGPGEQLNLSVGQEEQIVKDLRDWIEKEDPDLAEISNRLDTTALPSKP